MTFEFLKTSQVVCRPALPVDTAQVMELTRTIWEGHDYVPSTWKEWLDDPNGLLAVAELDGQVVGLGKLSLLSSAEWWLEGLHVHPKFEGRKIASHLHDYLLETWQRRGSGVIRLVTASYRHPVQHMCERSGFQKIGEFSEYGAAVLPGEAHLFSRLEPGEAETAEKIALNSPSLAFQYGLMDLYWRWARPSAEFICQAAGRAQAWRWRDRQGLLTFFEDDDNEQKYPMLQLQACQVEDLPAMLKDYRRLAAALGYTACRWDAPLHPGLRPALQEAGFQREWDASIFLYEKESADRVTRQPGD